MIELRVAVPEELVDPLESHFCEEFRSSWCLVRVEPNDPVVLSGYFEDPAALESAWATLRETFPSLPAAPPTFPVHDRDWMTAYRHHLTHWSCAQLHWIPEWERDTIELPPDAVAIYLDSGMAFGTGSHETTRLCARGILDYCSRVSAADRAGQALIDAGCGSGILALSAAGLGFGSVFGFDRDPEAVRVSEENARANGLGNAVTFAGGGIEDFLPAHKADCLVANIQSDVLRIYAPEIVEAVRHGGTLILSGILAHEAEGVAKAFVRQAGARVTTAPLIETDGEWARVVFVL